MLGLNLGKSFLGDFSQMTTTMVKTMTSTMTATEAKTKHEADVNLCLQKPIM